MKRTTLAAFAYIFLVFLSGVAVGGFGHWLYTTRAVSAKSSRPSPEEYRRRYVDEMKTRLKLSAEQVQQLNVVLDETKLRYRELRAKHKPDYEAIQAEQVRQINAFLSPQQQEEYARLREERERHRKQLDKDKHHRNSGGGF